MIELNLVQEHYSKMDDEELVRFACNESDHLTIDSFHLLKSEFEKRNLDIGILESVEIDQTLTEITRQTTAERITAFEFTAVIWKDALDQKALGKSNREIFEGLIKRGLAEEYAFMLIQSLDLKAKELVNDNDNGIIASWIALAISACGFFCAFVGDFSPLYMAYATLIAIPALIGLNRSSSNKEKYQKVCEQIAAEQLAEERVVKN